MTPDAPGSDTCACFREHPGFDDRHGSDAWNREAVWCRACAVVHQKRSHCPVLAALAHFREEDVRLSVERDSWEVRCYFCGGPSYPWLTNDKTWAKVEPLLGQQQACFECFGAAWFLLGLNDGEPFHIAKEPALTPTPDVRLDDFEVVRALQVLVDEQAEDEALWAIYPIGQQPIIEAYLQQELRKLHAAIEATVPALARLRERLEAAERARDEWEERYDELLIGVGGVWPG